jgi:hypothetical protein
MSQYYKDQTGAGAVVDKKPLAKKRVSRKKSAKTTVIVGDKA